MINKLKPKSEFSRNVLTLMTGTTIAQAIPIAISPILTRIYTPEDFGVFALFLAIISILGVVISARYEFAIILPRKDEDALHLVVLSLLIAFLLSMICLIIIIIFNVQIVSILDNPQITLWLYFIPFSLFLTGVYQSLNYWINRKKFYKRLAITRVIQSSSTATVNLSFGFTGLSSGLIIGQLLGQLISTFTLIKLTWIEVKQNLFFLNKIKLYAIAKRYSNFPKYDILASLINVSSHQLTYVLFNILFGAVSAGFFYLTQKIMSLPVVLIASSISDVFRQEASKEYKQLGNAWIIYKITFKKLFFLSLIPSFVLFFYSVEIFVLIFGEQWRISGEYAQILVPMLFLQFISSPLSSMFYIAEKQNINLILQILLLLLVLCSIFLPTNAKGVVILLSISFSLFYIVQLILSTFFAKGIKLSTILSRSSSV